MVAQLAEAKQQFRDSKARAQSMLSNAASNFRLQESTAQAHFNNHEAELNARAEQQSTRDACRAELHAQEKDV
eukprot:2447748-Heterocapsa_arctica.AAC.2